MLEKTYRFGELKKVMPGISQHTLTRQLLELEKNEIVYRKVYAEVPPGVEYSLTKRGESLRKIILMMRDWDTANLSL